MTSNNRVQLKFSEHRNSQWMLENCETVTNVSELEALYSSLILAKEIQVNSPHTIHLKGQTIPEFEHETPTAEEQKHLTEILIESQSNLSEIVVNSSPFAQNLQKRLTVLQRIYHATSKICHSPSTASLQLPATKDSDKGAESKTEENPPSGSEALVEVGVQTALGLLFALLKQNWQLSSQFGTAGLCNDVLSTALEIILSLPPLSLSNEAKLTSLGVKSLNQTACFLKSVFTASSAADRQGRQLSSELMLAIATQRGSLKCLLEWVELAMVSPPKGGENKEANIEIENKVNWNIFHRVVSQMMKSAGFPELKLSVDRSPDIDAEGNVPACWAAVCLLEQLHHLADDYSQSSLRFPLSHITDRPVTKPVQDSCSNTSVVSGSSTASSSTQDYCDIYIWGSNSTHQLAEGSQEKIVTPKPSTVFKDCPQVEAGQFCTFLVSRDGQVSACGKGSYGRLGLGDSTNQQIPKKLSFPKDVCIKTVSSSKGSDGHTLALSTTGEVYSWGDGDYGKLGHGNNSTQKFPKLITGLAGIVIVQVSAGFRHSAAISKEGDLYTWGEGDYGRLGHGDSTSKNLPTKVKDLPPVCQVACGSSHTVVIARDGKTVWSFGSGDSGKLGHGDTCRHYKPKVIEALAGVNVRKVVCGCHFSLALTTTGQLYAWGCGSVIGCGSPVATAVRPRLIEDLSGVRLVDVVSGDNHCLALTHDNQVYAWGNNAMGQCGQGHTQSPVTRPKKLTGLITKAPIQQISAGTSHSIAWTAVPSDRPLMSLHRPFCVDIREETFCILHQFLERYCHSCGSDVVPQPFHNQHEHQYFVVLCLQVLCIHLSLAQNSSSTKNLLGVQAKLLRNLLFKLIDMHTPDTVQKLVCECLSVGAQMLMPSLEDRMELLHSLLPQSPDCWNGLSKGQRMQLNMILSSLQNDNHISVLLGLHHVHIPALKFVPNLPMAEVLMKNILRNLAFETEAALTDIEKNSDKVVGCEVTETCCPQLHQLLSSIHKHLLAFCIHRDKTMRTSCGAMDLLQNHLQLMLPLCSQLLSQAGKLLASNQQGNFNMQDQVIDILYSSPAGSMLFHMLLSLLLVPQYRVVPLLNALLSLLSDLDQTCKNLSNIDRYEKRELEQSFNSSVSVLWLIDLERLCSLLIGNCLGDMLLGSPITLQEKQMDMWLENKLFSNGIQENANGSWKAEIESLVEQIMDNPDKLSQVYENLGSGLEQCTNTLALQLCFGIQTENVVYLLQFVQETAESLDLDTVNAEEEGLLDTVTRCILAAVITHCNLQETISSKNISVHDSMLVTAIRQIYQLRLELMNRKAFQIPGDKSSSMAEGYPTHTADSDTGEKSRQKDGEMNGYRDNSDDDGGAEEAESTLKVARQYSYEEQCADWLRRSFFLILAVRPYWQVTHHSSADETDHDQRSRNGVSSYTAVTQSTESRTVFGGHRGSHPDLQAYVQTQGNSAAVQQGTATPSFANRGNNTSTTASLQKVKQSLRRLRWHHEHSGDVTLGRKKGRTLHHTISGDVCSFIKGGYHQGGKKTKRESAAVADISYTTIEEALKEQHDRAESRLYAMNQIRELLSSQKEKGVEADSGSGTKSTLLGSAHLFLLAGCFNLGLVAGSHGDKIQRLTYYRDGITCAKTESQREIQLAVHDIYETLVDGLKEAWKTESSSPGSQLRLLLCSIFALSVGYKCVDMSLLVACGLVPTLYMMTGSTAMVQKLVHPVRGRLGQVQLNSVLRVASYRLVQIVTLTASVYSEQLSTGVLQTVVDLLWTQVNQHVDILCAQSSSLANFLVFVRRVAASKKIQALIANKKWTDTLVSLIRSKQGPSLRSKLAAIQILELVLPACDAKVAKDFLTQVISELFTCLSDNMWDVAEHQAVLDTRMEELSLICKIEQLKSGGQDASQLSPPSSRSVHLLVTDKKEEPTIMPSLSTILQPGTGSCLKGSYSGTLAEKGKISETVENLSELETTEGEEKSPPEGDVTVLEASFDAEKCVCCSVEGGSFLVHSTPGKGYGVVAIPISAGCYQWKFQITKENKSNEGTCIGVCRLPVRDYSHRTTADMWLYRAYSGNLYHNGEQSRTLGGFTQGDTVTCVLDMDSRTLAFGKNGEEPQVAFEDIDAAELYPCVTFYSSNPGEMVKVFDMQIETVPRDLLPGEPLCAPPSSVVCEALICLIRHLHVYGQWTDIVNGKIIQQIDKVTDLEVFESSRSKPDDIETGADKKEKKELPTNKAAEDGKKNDDAGSDRENVKSDRFSVLTDDKIHDLSTQIWPCLAVLGGLDSGLRVGGRCVHEGTCKQGTILGVTGSGALTVKVQWDNGEVSVSDLSVCTLKPLSSAGFDFGLLSGFTAKHLQVLMKLSYLSLDRKTGKPKVLKNQGVKKVPVKLSGEELAHAVMAESEARIAESDALMKKLDEDIARILNQESADNDHNADKRDLKCSDTESGPDLNESFVSVSSTASSGSNIVRNQSTDVGTMTGRSMDDESSGSNVTSNSSYLSAPSLTSVLQQSTSDADDDAQIVLDLGDSNSVQASDSIKFGMLENINKTVGNYNRLEESDSVTRGDHNEETDNYEELLVRALQRDIENVQNTESVPAAFEYSTGENNVDRNFSSGKSDRDSVLPELENVSKQKSESQFRKSDRENVLNFEQETNIKEKLNVFEPDFVENVQVCRPKEKPVEQDDADDAVKEIVSLKLAAVQITALKAMQCILASQKYGEMLLVPNSDLVADTSKALADGTVVRKDEEMKRVIYEFMKKLILIATSASPFNRVLGIIELDRTRAMLLKQAMKDQAEKKTNLPKLKESYKSLCAPASVSSADKLASTMSTSAIPKSILQQSSPAPSPSLANSQDRDTQRSLQQTSILQYIRSGSVDANTGRSNRNICLPHFLSRTQQDGHHPPSVTQTSQGPTAVTLRDLITIPPAAPPLRRPPPPQFTAPGLSTAPAHFKRRIQRSPSLPGVAPLFVPLMEMGFAVSHIESAIQAQETEADVWQVTSQCVNSLATWMIEHPQRAEPVGPPGEPGSSRADPSPSDGASAPKRIIGEEAAEPSAEEFATEMLIEESESFHPGFVRRPRRMTRTRHVDIRNFLSNLGDRPLQQPEPAEDPRPEPRNLLDLYEEVLDLQEELYSDMATDDIFSFENRETLDLFSALRRDIEEDILVTCELCRESVYSLNRHMRTQHPGCGESCDNYGYRSTGSYCGGWFGGQCGTGHPFYLMCPNCRQRYLGQGNSTTTTDPSQSDQLATSTEFQDSVEPSHLQEDSGYLRDSEAAYMRELEGWLPCLDNQEKLQQYLGLSDKKPTPDPVKFTASDPLGASFMDACRSVTVSSSDRSPIRCTWTSRVSPRPTAKGTSSLPEQALNLKTREERNLALHRTVRASQVTVARTVVLQALAVLSASGSSCSLPTALEKVGLSDIMMIVRLMHLCASGKITPANEDSGRLGVTSLDHLTAAIGSLIAENPKAKSQLLHLCIKELLAAALGKGQKVTDAATRLRNIRGQGTETKGDKSAESVTRSLVALLAKCPVTKIPGTAAKFQTGYRETSGGESAVSISQLLDALAACVMSTKVDPQYRQWAGIQLVQCIASPGLTTLCERPQLDLGADLAPCVLRKLEAHQNRLADCCWSDRKSLLATRYTFIQSLAINV